MMARQNHSMQAGVAKREKLSESSKEDKQSKQSCSDMECDNEWFNFIDDLDDIPMFRREEY